MVSYGHEQHYDKVLRTSTRNTDDRGESKSLNGDILDAFLSSFGGVEDSTLITSVSGTANGDYVFTMILNTGVFHATPHTITYKDTTMMQQKLMIQQLLLLLQLQRP